jgi:hypothetical protein
VGVSFTRQKAPAKMRVTTDLFVSSLVRRIFATGGFAAVVKRGATEAGAVFVIARGRLGDASLYGPAPQTSYDESRPDERRFMPLNQGDDAEALDRRLEKEARFDPDVWIIEVEASQIPIEELIPVVST